MKQTLLEHILKVILITIGVFWIFFLLLGVVVNT
jgi:hypothetical protein